MVPVCLPWRLLAPSPSLWGCLAVSTFSPYHTSSLIALQASPPRLLLGSLGGILFSLLTSQTQFYLQVLPLDWLCSRPVPARGIRIWGMRRFCARAPGQCWVLESPLSGAGSFCVCGTCGAANFPFKDTVRQTSALFPSAPTQCLLPLRRPHWMGILSFPSP